MKAMATCGDMDRLLGGGKASLQSAAPMLREFWRRFQLCFPKHQVFEKSIPLERATPLYIHGDEGQTYKKSGVLLISFQSAIGLGSKRTPLAAEMTNEEKDLEKAGIPVNFLKTGLQSRFLSIVAPKAGYVPKMFDFFLSVKGSVVAGFLYSFWGWIVPSILGWSKTPTMAFAIEFDQSIL